MKNNFFNRDSAPVSIDGYTLYKRTYHGKTVIEIVMDTYSPQFFLKSILYTEHSSTFLCSLINLFRLLKAEDTYFVYSHSITLLILKILERRHIVKILDIEKSDREDLDEYYKALGKDGKNNKVKMYDITFAKKRDIGPQDIPAIERIMSALNIDKKTILFNFKHAVLRAHVNRLNILKSFAVANPPRQIFEKCKRLVK